MATNASQLTNKSGELPPGSPTWISRDLLDLTIQTWQKYSKSLLTDEDALEILLNTSALLNALEHL